MPRKARTEADISYMCWKRLTNHIGVGQLANQSRLGFLKETGAKTKSFRQRLKRGAAAMDSLMKGYVRAEPGQLFDKEPYTASVRHMVKLCSEEQEVLANNCFNPPKQKDMGVLSMFRSARLFLSAHQRG
ncbi:unnamed protein product [Pleuronectes platessa]|uniref:Uncharacterized protein n=1 Tax=Pleuronectes platessa TaxID=8262 RepID=A0A9N7TKX0_PLEPL|nr:unnamed protein product [Pleuronectes platessa]